MSRLPSDEGGPRAHDDKHGEPVDDQYEGRYSGGLGEVEPPHGLLQLQTTTDPGRPPGCQPSILSNQYGITHKLHQRRTLGPRWLAIERQVQVSFKRG